MKTVILAEQTDRDSIHLATALKELDNQKVRVYYTTAVSSDLTYRIVTTSKDVHLALGRLLPGTQILFAMFLHRELGDDSRGILLLIDEVKESGLLATRVESDGNLITIHLSIAR